MSEYDPKTSIKSIPVANDRLYGEVGKLTKVNETEVKVIVEFIGEYISRIMKKGDMEGVMIPYFGKFRPKIKKLRAMKKAQMNRANGMDMVFRAVRGKMIVDFRDKNNITIETTENETI